MRLQIQYNFFETKEEAELAELRKYVSEVRSSNDKVRKGLFARHNELCKMYVDYITGLKSLREIYATNRRRGLHV